MRSLTAGTRVRHPGGALEAQAQRASRPPRAAESAKVEISELVFSVLEAAKHPDVVPLGSAFPSPQLFPLQRLAKSLGHASRLISPWSTVVDLAPGNEALRRQISLGFLGMGIAQPMDELVVTNGALEALNLCLMAVTRPGDVIAIESPGFYAALQAIERLDLRGRDSRRSGHGHRSARAGGSVRPAAALRRFRSCTHLNA